MKCWITSKTAPLKKVNRLSIKTDENSIYIYLNDISISKGEEDTYKLYKIKIKGEYEYLKVFKNGEETHFAGIGG